MIRQLSIWVVGVPLSCLALSSAIAGPAARTPSESGRVQRLITIADMAALRRVDTLSVSPDGRRFAIFVRQGDPATNAFRTEWFVGSTAGGELLAAGDGGEIGLATGASGRTVGSLEQRQSRWSPDGRWFAYAMRRHGELQLWASSADGGVQKQLTHSAADVLDFRWSDDSERLHFTVTEPREDQRRRQVSEARQGYRYDSDLYAFSDLMLPGLERSVATTQDVWVVTLRNAQERLANEAERAAFLDARTTNAVKDALGVPQMRPDGALTWMKRVHPFGASSRVVVSTPEGTEIACNDVHCAGFIRMAWWSEDGQRVLYWRNEGVLDASAGFFAWSPSTSRVESVLRALDDTFNLCSRAAADRIICVSETPVRPAHLVAIDMRSGAKEVLADLNPDFRNIKLGRVERLEWDTPTFPWSEAGGPLANVYPRRAFGYILFPPDFNASKKYPVFIDPYAAVGFDNQVNAEYALHVYAASGIVVLNTQFPMPVDVVARLGPTAMKQEYSAALRAPRLTMLTESTLRALDIAAAREFVDVHRVGIGGVSHGTFIPLHMLQSHDRLAAVSISTAPRGPFEYYWATKKGRDVMSAAFGPGYEDWMVRPECETRPFWSQLDIADHVERIEAPILMNLPAAESYGALRLIRHLADAGKPYDAYIYPDETHIKWQPAHLRVIMERNLDWFRFWLQDHEDPEPRKAEQYSRWRQLRGQRDPDPVN